MDVRQRNIKLSSLQRDKHQARAMTPEAAALMASYNRWMNRRMYQAAATLPDVALRQDRGAFFGSIQATLNHIAVADTIWLHRFSQPEAASDLRAAMQPFPLPTSLRQELADSFAELQRHRAALDAVITQWAAQLTTSQLSGELTYRNTAGKTFTRAWGPLVLHFFNHQTHHRGQTSTLLFQAGVDVGVTDLIALPDEEL
jgi:uncharacterized damage-inducible protein DinB